IGIAGVMGGFETEISDGTTEVLLEAAVFDAVSVARSARRHKLPSEAAKRFQRGIDSSVTRAALDRAAKLIAELSGSQLSDFGSVTGAAKEPWQISLPKDFANKIIGVDYSADRIEAALEAIGCTVA